MIDQEIKEKFITPLGLDIIAELNLASFSYLVTGLAQDKEIKMRAKSLGVSIIDKLDIERTKFIQTTDLSSVTHILIDDDLGNHSLWRRSFAGLPLSPKCFLNIDEFLKVQRLIPRSTEIFVDLYNEGEPTGITDARQIRQLGFSIVKISTSAPSLEVGEIKNEFEVVSKFEPLTPTTLS